MELLICFKGAVIYSSQFFRGAAKFSFQNCLHFLQGDPIYFMNTNLLS